MKASQTKFSINLFTSFQGETWAYGVDIAFTGVHGFGDAQFVTA
jgi:hypothetical protein